MEKNNLYDNYTQLLEKVDEMFSRVYDRHKARFSCQKACYGCCQAGLTVTSVERSRIADWLRAHPKKLERIRDKSSMLNDSRFCALLDSDGLCSIYEVRPLICRSHGMPISWKIDGSDADQEQRDVCPLNFVETDIASLEKSDVLSVDRVNVLLSLINRAFDEKLANERYELSEISKIIFD